MSNTNHTKRNLGRRKPTFKSIKALHPPPSATPLDLSGLHWSLLSFLGGWATLHISELWAPHLDVVHRLPLAASAFLTLFFCRSLGFPPQDPQSRLRAFWFPQTKKWALIYSGIFLGWSLFFAYQKSQMTYPQLTLSQIEGVQILKAGPYLLTGSPLIDQQPYRWMGSEDDLNAPYLIPVKELKGHVLAVANTDKVPPFNQTFGQLIPIDPRSSPSFMSYRNSMNLSPTAALYLFDLRSRPWFDVKVWTLVWLSLLLFIGVASTATRDPLNPSKTLYIPEDLRSSLTDDDRQSRSFDEENKAHTDSDNNDDLHQIDS